MGLGLPGERAGSDARYSSSLFLAPRHAVLAEGAWKPAQALLLMAGLMATVYAIKTGLKSDGAWWLSLVIGCIGTAMLAWFVRIQLRSTHAMLDMSLFSKPAIRMGVVMALVVMGSLAGVELLLAQELQFVTGRSPLEAGLFMLPLMAASAVGDRLQVSFSERLDCGWSQRISGACHDQHRWVGVQRFQQCRLRRGRSDGGSWPCIGRWADGFFGGHHEQRAGGESGLGWRPGGDKL